MTAQERAALVALVAKWRTESQVLRYPDSFAVHVCATELEAALSALPSGGAEGEPEPKPVTTGRHADDYGAGLAEERRQKKEPV